MERTAAGDWVELGAAPLDGDFAGRIDALRVEALARGGDSVPIDLWLPPDQVLVRRYVLPAGLRGRAEALRRLSAETTRAPHELSLAVAPASPGKPATVLAVPTRTIAEARHYAGRWGFRAGRVSTRVEAGCFGDAGPDFRDHRGYALPTFGAMSGTAAAAAAAVLLGIAAWGLSSAEAPAPVAGTVAKTRPDLALARVEAGAPDLSRTSVTQVGHPQVQPLQTHRQGTARDKAPTLAAFTGTPIVGLAPPSDAVTLHVGPAPALPRHLRPGRLERVAAVSRQTDVTALVLGIDRIRATAHQQAEAVTEPRILLASADATGSAAPAGAPMIAALVTVADEPASSEAAIRLAAAESMAPRSVPLLPPPRPETETKAETETEPAAEEAPETDPEATAESGSELAAETAPRPPGKPEQKAKKLQHSIAHRAVAAGKPSPSRVREAASKHGLELDSTNLIGVLDVKSGRKALLRMSGGEYLKVGRGDTVDGWRVSAINRDSVRLTHGNQSRTLLLVVR